MKKIAVVAICLVLSCNDLSFGQVDGLISGLASIDGKPLSNITVRLRNVDNGQLVGNTTSSATGQFSFPGLSPGNFVIEMVSANGTIIGTSASVALTAATMVATNVTVGASAASIAAAGGAGAIGAGSAIGAATAAAGTGAAAAGAVAGGAAAAGAVGLSATVVAVSAVGVTLGTAAVVAVANDASPSR